MSIHGIVTEAYLVEHLSIWVAPNTTVVVLHAYNLTQSIVMTCDLQLVLYVAIMEVANRLHLVDVYNPPNPPTHLSRKLQLNHKTPPIAQLAIVDQYSQRSVASGHITTQVTVKEAETGNSKGKQIARNKGIKATYLVKLSRVAATLCCCHQSYILSNQRKIM